MISFSASCLVSCEFRRRSPRLRGEKRFRGPLLRFPMSDERAKKIKLMLFDVDGVMTDGTIFLFPAPGGEARSPTSIAKRWPIKADSASPAAGIEAKGFNAHDGQVFRWPGWAD